MFRLVTFFAITNFFAFLLHIILARIVVIIIIIMLNLNEFVFAIDVGTLAFATRVLKRFVDLSTKHTAVAFLFRVFFGECATGAVVVLLTAERRGHWCRCWLWIGGGGRGAHFDRRRCRTATGRRRFGRCTGCRLGGGSRRGRRLGGRSSSCCRLARRRGAGCCGCCCCCCCRRFGRRCNGGGRSCRSGSRRGRCCRRRCRRLSVNL
mmetsp:Transcript_10979/g.18381  ORF Transcript_10979/g.18381 Transcript_10979/m.18381 type:complete len:207 (-) Transcript_10979:83-703(-)